jgi:hypothetical protein
MIIFRNFFYRKVYKICHILRHVSIKNYFKSLRFD